MEDIIGNITITLDQIKHVLFPYHIEIVQDKFDPMQYEIHKQYYLHFVLICL